MFIIGYPISFWLDLPIRDNYTFSELKIHFRLDQASLGTKTGIKIDRNDWKISLYRVVIMDDMNSDFGKSTDGLGTLLEGLESKREIYVTTIRHCTRPRYNGDRSLAIYNTYAGRGVGLSETTGRTLP